MNRLTYLPGSFYSDHRKNVVRVSDLHLFDDHVEQTAEEISRKLERYSKTYDAEEIHFLGDIGYLEDVKSLLEHIETPEKAVLVAGDEDKFSHESGSNPRWYRKMVEEDRTIEATDLEVETADEGFRTQMNGFDISMSHHPEDSDRKTLEGDDGCEVEFSEKWFSTEKLYRQSDSYIVPSHDPDVIGYGHSHTDITRVINDTAVLGTGAWSLPYQICSKEAELMQNGSVHVDSYGFREMESLHLDPATHRMLEHHRMTKEDGGVEWEMLGSKVPLTRRIKKEVRINQEIPEEQVETKELPRTLVNDPPGTITSERSLGRVTQDRNRTS